MNIESLLLLLCGYVRKTNHPEETDTQIAQCVIADLKKVNNNLLVVDHSEMEADKPTQQVK